MGLWTPQMTLQMEEEVKQQAAQTGRASMALTALAHANGPAQRNANSAQPAQ
jgi:hypothetical protein